MLRIDQHNLQGCIKPETCSLMLKYSKKDERSVSWIVDKAIRPWLEKGEEEGE